MADFKRPFRARPVVRRPANVVQFQRRPRGKRSKGQMAWWAWAALIVAPVLGIGMAWLWHTADVSSIQPQSLLNRTPAAEQYTVTFSECSGPIRANCVVDGDTFWLNGEKIRIADINTPEIGEPQCPEEARRGAQATRRLLDLMNEGGFSLESVDRDRDRYGRKLRVVTRGGDSIGEVLVREGLAERWKGYRGNWC